MLTLHDTASDNNPLRIESMNEINDSERPCLETFIPDLCSQYISLRCVLEQVHVQVIGFRDARKRRLNDLLAAEELMNLQRGPPPAADPGGRLRCQSPIRQPLRGSIAAVRRFQPSG